MRAAEPHPDVQELLDLIEAVDTLPISQYGAERARELSAEMRPDVDGPPVGSVTDRTIPGFEGDGPDVEVRIYVPEGEGPYPTVVYFHGGGFVLGDVDGHDVTCRELVRESGCALVSVDYRKAPENPFPAAVEDAYAATQWTAGDHDEFDATGALAVAGDSAGGNLAAAVTLMARDREDGPRIDYQALVYPTVTNRITESRAELGADYYLVEADMQWFDECYFGSSIHEANPYAYPLHACEHTDLPPASVITAGFDPLRDEGAAYAETLQTAGVPVEHRNYEDMIHGFFSMLAGDSDLERGHEAVADVAADLRNALA